MLWKIGIVAGIVVLSAGAVTFKKYEVKSGELRYLIEGSGNVMGAKMEEDGTKRLIFDQYGFREWTEEKSARRTEVMGQVSLDRTDRVIFRNGTKVQEADRIHKTLREYEAPGMAQMVAAARQNLAQMGEAFLKQMGGKRIGTDRVAGYPCELWRLPGVTQCLYKGVPLRIVTEVMGQRRSETAVEAKFDLPIDPQRYRVPAYPRSAAAVPGGISPMGEGALPAMPPAGASVRGGDPSAMMLEGMKRELLRREKDLRFVRRCLEGSRTLAEANACEKRFSQRLGEASEPMKRWDGATKKKTLKEIDDALKAMECVKRAKSMAEIEGCGP
jgi:hypothetical protein